MSPYSLTNWGCSSPVVKVLDHGWHVMSLNPVPLKNSHIGQRYTLNLSRVETSSRWCGGPVLFRRLVSTEPEESLGEIFKAEMHRPLSLGFVWGLSKKSSISKVTKDYRSLRKTPASPRAFKVATCWAFIKLWKEDDSRLTCMLSPFP
ncbi:hypothetical protein TNCV_2187541 [Trichonephila clavipes]|nr:hypothetical protein TNCV_2187541 [Trichonephila clavipes]